MNLNHVLFTHCLSKISVTALILLLAICRSANCQLKQLVKPENEEIILMGKIRLIHDYGPPGYGEDPKRDSRVTYWALEVPVQVNLPCTGDFVADCEPTNRINLYFEGDEMKRIAEMRPSKWKDRRVLVRGKLHRADTVGEMTPIYMDAIDITRPTHKR